MEYCLWICVFRVAAEGGEYHLNRPDETSTPGKQHLLPNVTMRKLGNSRYAPPCYRLLTINQVQGVQPL